jgi:hypothetical protein
MENTPEWRELEDAIMGNVAAPVGALAVDEWSDGLTPHAYRTFRGSTREVPVRYSDDNVVRVTVEGTQKPDGSLDEHGIRISGAPYDLISADEARGIAAALIAAAGEIDGWAR